VSFRRRVLIGFLLNLVVAAGLAWWMARHELVPTGKRVMEETLVDVANLIAELVAPDIEGPHGTERLDQALRNYAGRRFGAQIYDVIKDAPDVHVYVTDAQGRVVFDSQQRAVGQDFSKWHDIERTLRGSYGARSSHIAVQTGDAPAIDRHYIYVAAPIMRSGVRIGAVSVGKDAGRILDYQRHAEHNVVYLLIVLAVLSTLMAIGFGRMLTGKLNQLGQYAEAASAGAAVSVPALHTPELDRLAADIATMRERLEGRDYVEQYVQSLTHAMKSPVAGIAAAAEILDTEPDDTQRQRFVRHIAEQSARLHGTLEQMLRIARLEATDRKLTLSRVLVAEVLRAAANRVAALAAQQNIAFTITGEAEIILHADKALLSEAIAALVENAVAFANADSTIVLHVEASSSEVIITLANQGPMIPLFAQSRIFERFYSLPRPGAAQRSSGLGLSFAKLVAEVHHGSLAVQNRDDGSGVTATLRLPAR
jgi:two-component system sensor histidine kinase CreC